MATNHKPKVITGELGDLLSSKRDACSARAEAKRKVYLAHLSATGRTVSDDNLVQGSDPVRQNPRIEDAPEAIVEEQPETPQLKQEPEPEIDLFTDPNPQ